MGAYMVCETEGIWLEFWSLGVMLSMRMMLKLGDTIFGAIELYEGILSQPHYRMNRPLQKRDLCTEAHTHPETKSS
jgi:hypothetical protein